MPIATDPTKTWPYILECDRKLPEPTVFTLRTLTPSQAAKIEDAASTYDRDSDVINVNTGTKTLATVRLGLAGVERFSTPWAEDKDGCPTEDFLRRLHPSWLSELATAINDRNTLSETDRKN